MRHLKAVAQAWNSAVDQWERLPSIVRRLISSSAIGGVGLIAGVVIGVNL